MSEQKKIIKYEDLQKSPSNMVVSRENLAMVEPAVEEYALILLFEKDYIKTGLGLLNNSGIEILASSSYKTVGLLDGSNQNIEKSYQDLKKNINDLKRSASIKNISGVKVYCSISKKFGKRIVGQRGVLNFMGGEVKEVDIDKALSTAISNTVIPQSLRFSNLEITKYKVDELETTKSPVGAECKRFEVEMDIQVVNSAYFANIERVMSKANLNLEMVRFSEDNIIETVLSDEERELGTILIEVGEDETKIYFCEDGKLKETKEIQIGRLNIIRSIQRSFSVNQKSATYIMDNIEYISSKSKGIGFFEIERVDGAIQKINLAQLYDVISSALIEIFDKIKEVLQIKNLYSKYTNGIILLLNGIKVNGLDGLVKEYFKSDVVELREGVAAPLYLGEKIKSAELLENNREMMGMSKMISESRENVVNHKFERRGYDGETKKFEENREKERSDLDTMADEVSEIITEKGILSSIKKFFKEIW